MVGPLRGCETFAQCTSSMRNWNSISPKLLENYTHLGWNWHTFRSTTQNQNLSTNQHTTNRFECSHLQSPTCLWLLSRSGAPKSFSQIPWRQSIFDTGRCVWILWQFQWRNRGSFFIVRSWSVFHTKKPDVNKQYWIKRVFIVHVDKRLKRPQMLVWEGFLYWWRSFFRKMCRWLVSSPHSTVVWLSPVPSLSKVR